jgi:cytochrome c556
MLRMLPVKQSRMSAIAAPAAAALVAAALAVALALTPAARSEDRVPGLTGIDHADDVVGARQSLMDGIDADMMAIDLFGAGTNAPLAVLKEHADRISTLLSIFPHLFPPQTKPSDNQAIPTTATPAVWANFDDFYAKAQAAAMIALDATRAETADKFKDEGKKLRAACDGCHATYMHVESPPTP